MVFGITPSLYAKVGSYIFGAYGLQMLVVPENMMTDHFNAKPTEYTTFWVRGQAASMATIIYLLQKVESEVAAKAMLGFSAAVAILYPFNAKFGYLSKLDVKCESLARSHVHPSYAPISTDMAFPSLS